VIFVAGTGRSGSTALARYVESTTNSFHAGEIRYLWERGVVGNQLCECGETFRDCSFWSEVLQVAYGDSWPEATAALQALGPRIDRMRHIPRVAAGSARLGPTTVSLEYGRHLEPLYSAIAEVSGCDVLIDSSKDPSYLFALSSFERLDLRVLHLVRDSRAVAYSWTRKRLRPEIHWEEQYMNMLPPWKSASLWLEYNLAINVYRRMNRDSSTLLRYEDFASAPSDTCAAALATLVPDRNCALSGNKPTGHSFSGNPMRFNKGPLSISADNAWERELSGRDRRAVSLITAPLLSQYGYRPW
jgi:hypothetical protein